MKSSKHFRTSSIYKFILPSIILIFSILLLSNYKTVQATLLLSDDFSDSTMDSTKWRLGVLTRTSLHLDSEVQVTETNGHLVISPRIKFSRRSYNGYVTVNSVNLTNSHADIEIISTTQSKAETLFAIGLDKNNYFRFRQKGSTLYLEYMSDGTIDRTTAEFDLNSHRFWRINHNQGTGTVNFETSADHSQWSVLKTVTPTFPITHIFAEITAGSSNMTGKPGLAEFDNFVVGTNDTSPTPTPTITPTPTPSPTVTPTPTPNPNNGLSRGYLTTPEELGEIKSKANQNIEPYKSSMDEAMRIAGSPTNWSLGTVNPTDRSALKDASAALYAKSMAYHLTGDSQYAETVRQKILEISTTGTCPNTYSGGNGCILTLSRHISGYISAADLIADYPGWTASDKLTFQIWLRDKVYPFTDWANDNRSTNWGSVGTATTLYIADYFAGSSLNLIDRDGNSFTPHQAYIEARQRAIDRNNGNSYMYNSVCDISTGLGIQDYGGIPEETGRDTTGCWGTYLLTDDSSWSYMIAHLSGTISTAELLLRRGDNSLYENIQSDGRGSILKAILYVIDNPNDPNPPNHSFDWINSRKSILEIAYRYYRHPSMAEQLGIGTNDRNVDSDNNSAMPHFGSLTHGFAIGENPGLPPTVPSP